MNELIATSNRVLEIDLSTRQVSEFLISPNDRRLYLGGKGLGIKYLSERLKPGVDPLGAENYLILMMGIYLGSGAPCSGRFSGIAKSPLTGIVVHSSCGGPFGMAFKTAGYEGLILKGKADQPVLLEIDAQGVKFQDASHLWGLDSVESQQALALGKRDGALVIGPAGENLVHFASIVSGHRYLGRGGLGAVMGSKNLKAILARGGEYKIIPQEPAAFKQLFRKATQMVNKNDFVGRLYRTYGTNTNVRLSNRAGILPVENFRHGHSSQAEQVAGETIMVDYKTRPSTCQPCTILCGHSAEYPQGKRQVPEYETTALLGPNLGIYDPLLLADWNELCGRLGMDTISTGGTLAYTMEAGEKGLLQTPLRFGSSEGIAQAITDIAYRRGQGAEMANGSRWMAQQYGGMEFAIQVKGMEMAGYDPRGSWGQGLSYAVANRGACHLTSAVFAMEAFMNFLQPYTTRSKVKYVRYLENLMAALNALHVCSFTSFPFLLEAPAVKLTPHPLLAFTMLYLPDIALQLMDLSPYTRLYESISGLKISPKEFLQAGERITVLERWMNTREGTSRADDTLPARLLTETRIGDERQAVVPLEKMLDEFYKLRGYDEQGIPRRATLEALSIPFG